MIVLMDTTYCGWRFGVVVFKDAVTGKVLWRKFINRKETLSDYVEGISWLSANNFQIRGIVCDGLRGIFKLFSSYKVQMCQYHQIAIVRRYLTRRPELPAGISLLQLVKTLSVSNKKDFIKHFNEWEFEWDACIKERKTDSHTGKSYYVHKKLRSAYLSLKRNMNWLFTFEQELLMPNTNNALEELFTDLKTKLRNHNGLSTEHRKVFIDEFFKRSFYP